MSRILLTVVKETGLRCDSHHSTTSRAHRDDHRATSDTEEPGMTDLDLTGRKALVTGGAQGLGEGMAHALASAGATVVIADLQDDLGPKVAESLGEGHSFVHLDTTDDGNWESAVADATAHLGGLDILLNNAGIEITSLLVDLDPAAALKQLEVNLLGTAL